MANKHCRKFNNHEDYISALIDGELIKHNISYCKMEKDAHYDKQLDDAYMIECHYYITDATRNYRIYNLDYGAYRCFKDIVIDGNKIENYRFQYDYMYKFNTPGEHIIKYNFQNSSIPTRSFMDCSTLISVRYPNIYNINVINADAFKNDASLTELLLPKNILSIYHDAYGSCSLTSVTIPDTVKYIESTPNYYLAFTSNKKLESITVDPNNTVYDSRNNCNAIINTSSNTLVVGCKNTVIPNTVTTIGSYAFTGIPITNVTLPNILTTILKGAFFNSEIESINIPASVTNIDTNYTAFGNNYNLASITVDPNNTVYDSRNNCNAIISTSSNTLVVGCKNTVIPNTVTTIGLYAFSGCGILELVIPASVTNIPQSGGTGTFENVYSLKYVTMESTTPPTMGSINGPGDFSGLYPIFVPEESVDLYKSTTQGWSRLASRIYPEPSNYEEFLELYETLLDEEQLIVIQFNITDISKPTRLYYTDNGNYINLIKIDGIGAPTNSSTFLFKATGIHTVKYLYTTSSSNNHVYAGTFTNLEYVKSISIPTRNPSFSTRAFGIENVDYVILYSTTPQGIQDSGVFPASCPIYVPDESVLTYKTYNATWLTLASRIYPLSDLQQ